MRNLRRRETRLVGPRAFGADRDLGRRHDRDARGIARERAPRSVPRAARRPGPHARGQRARSAGLRLHSARPRGGARVLQCLWGWRPPHGRRARDGGRRRDRVRHGRQLRRSADGNASPRRSRRARPPSRTRAALPAGLTSQRRQRAHASVAPGPAPKPSGTPSYQPWCARNPSRRRRAPRVRPVRHLSSAPAAGPRSRARTSR